MNRTPSLRDLRRNLPANVTILPTAPDRRIPSNQTRAGYKARAALKAAQVREFPYRNPVDRERDQRKAAEANATAHIERTPALLISMAVFGTMEEAARQRALALAEVMAMSGDQAAKDGLTMMREVMRVTRACDAVAKIYEQPSPD